jgi:hypothetical protein
MMKLKEKTSRPDYLFNPGLKLNCVRVVPIWSSQLDRFKYNQDDC